MPLPFLLPFSSAIKNAKRQQTAFLSLREAIIFPVPYRKRQYITRCYDGPGWCGRF